MLFDSHIHYAGATPLAKALPELKAHFEKYEIQKVVFLSLTRNDDGLKKVSEIDYTQNPKGLFYKHFFGKNAYAYAGLEEDLSLSKEEMAKDFVRQAKEYMENGFDGIKLFEGKPMIRAVLGFSLDDAVYEPFFEYMEKNGFPITLHNADPKEFWDVSTATESAVANGWVVAPGQPSKRDFHETVFTVLKRHPKLKLTSAHLGFYTDEGDMVLRYFAYPNTKLDLTPGSEQYQFMSENHDFWYSLFEKYPDRFKYGTDTYNWEFSAWQCSDEPEGARIVRIFEETNDFYRSPWGSDFTGFALPRDIVEKINYQNAEKELGQSKPINRDYLIKKVKEVSKKCVLDFDKDDFAFMLRYLEQ